MEFLAKIKAHLIVGKREMDWSCFKSARLFPVIKGISKLALIFITH